MIEQTMDRINAEQKNQQTIVDNLQVAETDAEEVKGGLSKVGCGTLVIPTSNTL
jgi:hypothetical protein